MPWLDVERVGANLVARTDLGRADAGDPRRPHRHGPRQRQRRAADRRRHAVGPRQLRHEGRARRDARAGPTVAEPAVDVTYVFYAGEEVAAVHNGLAHLFRDRPDLLAGRRRHPRRADRRRRSRPGARARSASRSPSTGSGPTRPVRGWVATPSTASAPLRPSLDALRGAASRPPGLRVPRGPAGRAGQRRGGRQRRSRRRDRHDQPPLRAGPHEREAEAAVRERSRRCSRTATTSGWSTSPAPRRPGARHPHPRSLIEPQPPHGARQAGLDRRRPLRRPRDPGANFGPGDATIAHTADERVERAPIEHCHVALVDLVTRPEA